MDPALFSLPEIILNDRGDCTQSGSLSFSDLRSPIAAEMLSSNANSDQRMDTQSWTQRDFNQQAVQHLIPSWTGPIQPWIQAQDSPSPLNLQTLSPGAEFHSGLTPFLPELVFTSCSPQDSCWLNMSPVASMPNSSLGFSPCVLTPFSSPTEFWYSTCSPPHSCLLLPEVRPSWCLCPQTVPVHQPCSPDLVLRRAAQQVSEQLNVTSAASGKEQNEEQAKSEEEQQENDTPDKERQQANNTDDETTKSEVSPGTLSPLDEDSLAERAFEEYMVIMDSLSPKIQEGVEAKDNENEVENGSFLKYLDELCSDEDFVRTVESALNIELLDSLLSSDAEPIDLLALEKQEQEVTLQDQRPSADVDIDPVIDGTSLVGSTLNVEYLDSLLSSDPESIDLHPQKTLEVILGETAPLQRAQSPILDPPGSQWDTNPNHDGQNACLSMRDIGSKEVCTACSPRLPSLLLEDPQPTDSTPNHHNPVDTMSPLYGDCSLFMDYSFNSSQQLLASVSGDSSLTSDLEATDKEALIEEPAAIFPIADVSEEASMSLSDLTDTQSAQTSQKLQEGLLPGDPPASESLATSSVSVSNEDSHTIVVKNPAPSFRADLLTVSPPQSAGPPAQKTLPHPLPPSPEAQIREPEEQHSPESINPKSSCLEDYAIPVPANSSFVADSPAESCDTPVDGNLSDSVPEKQPKGLQVSEELASSGVSSELRAGERGETERECKKNLGKSVGTTVTQKEAIKARGRTKNAFERKGDDKETETKLKGTTNTRRSQRLSGLRLSGEFTTERAEEKNPSEKSIKKTSKSTPERDRVIYKNQKRRPSGGRQLSKREESHFEEQSQATERANTAELFSEMREKEQQLSGERQKLKVEGEEQCEANHPESTEIGAENALLTKAKQEEKEQLTPLPVAGARGKIKHSETERSEMKSSPKREMQDEGDTKENKTEPQTLPVSSPMKRRGGQSDGEESRERANNANSTGRKTNKDKVSGICSPVSLPKSSLENPGVQTDTLSTKDSVEEPPGEGPLDERHESPTVKTCEKIPNLTPALCPETRQQSKTVALSAETDFYSLRSGIHKPKVSVRALNRTGIQEKEATHHPLDPKPNPDQTEDVKGEDERINIEEAEHLSLLLSPMKRHRHERGASEERETRVNETDKVRTETEMISSSPMKRGRWMRRVEVKTEREQQQEFTAPSGCKPSIRSNTKAKNEKISDLAAGRDSFKKVQKALKPDRVARELTSHVFLIRDKHVLYKTNRPKRQLRRKESL